MIPRKIAIRLFIILILMLPVEALSVSDPCPPFYLRTHTGSIINPITGENADEPFSTRKTCGPCHDVDAISRGYHFNMDWDKASDERFKETATPWRASSGLTGSMTTYGYYFLAKKKNTHPDQIDLTAFDFIARAPEKTGNFQKPGCAACHAGGGMLEFDRDGNRYDVHLKENPDLSKTLDGDYYNSRWDKTGVIEPDCFICHSSRYHMQTRIAQMIRLNFKWAGTAAAGIGQVTGSIKDGGSPKVIYNRRLFNEDGRFIMPEMLFKPQAENCLLCHESIELGKRGMSWDDPESPDVHHLAGLTCTDCHPGDIRHNFAKGNANANTVADELDNTMRSCCECHETGYKGATRLKHRRIRKDHLDKLSCEACHIPELYRSAVGAMYVGTGSFGKTGQIGTKRFGELRPWKPAYIKRAKDKDGVTRITPVNPYYASLFTNKEASGVHIPLFLSEMKTAYDACKDELSQRQNPRVFHLPEDIKLMLQTLKRTLSGNQRFDSVFPHYHDGTAVYYLDKQEGLIRTEDTTWVADIPYFSISHNVAPVEKSLGYGGCRDCHSEESHILGGRVVTRFFGEDGKPETIPMALLLDLSPDIKLFQGFFSLYLSAAPLFFSAAGLLLIFFPAIRVLVASYRKNTPDKTTRTGIWIVPVGALLFFLCHLVLTKNLGVLDQIIRSNLWQQALPIAAMLMTAAGFVMFARNRIQNRMVFGLAAALALVILLTGLFLWTGWLSGGISTILFILHCTAAVLMAVAFLWLVIRGK